MNPHQQLGISSKMPQNTIFLLVFFFSLQKKAQMVWDYSFVSCQPRMRGHVRQDYGKGQGKVPAFGRLAPNRSPASSQPRQNQKKSMK